MKWETHLRENVPTIDNFYVGPIHNKPIDPFFLKDVNCCKKTNVHNTITRSTSCNVVWYGKKNQNLYVIIDLKCRGSMVDSNLKKGRQIIV